MPAAWQASGVLLGSTGADITPVIPAHATDDILICLATSRVVTDTCLTPSGWTLKSGPTNNTGWRVYVFWKRATSGAETNPLLDWTGTGEKYGQVHTVRGGIRTGDPFAAATLTVDLTDPIVATGVTTTAAGQRVIALGIGSDNASASVTVTATDPATLTQHHFSTIATGADATGSAHSNTRATAGATGNVTLDHNSTMPAEGVFVAAMLEEPAPIFDQSHFRFRNDDGSETTATWKAAEDTDITITTADRDTNIRLRIVLQNSGGVADQFGPERQFRLQCRKNAGSWQDVTGSSTIVRSSLSANFAEDDASTNQIGGTGTFAEGDMDEVDGIVTAGAEIPATGHTEFEHCFQVRSADTADLDVIDFRYVDLDFVALSAYSQTPTITIDDGGAPPPTEDPYPFIGGGYYPSEG